MAKPTLTFEFESEGRRYVVGDSVRGVLRVEVDRSTECQGLELSLSWRTHGRGASDGACVAESRPVDHAIWVPGHDEIYPFEFTVPPGPLTYHGELLNVDWYVGATPTIPWTLTRTVSEDVLVELGDYTGAVDSGAPTAGLLGELGVNTPAIRRRDGIRPRLVELGVGVALAAWWGIGHELESFGDVSLLCVFLAMAAAGAVRLAMAVMATLAERSVGGVEIAVEPNVVALGQEVRCRVSYDRGASRSGIALSARFRGREWVAEGGSSQTTYEHELLALQVPLEERTSADQGPAAWEGSFVVPADAPPSFFASSGHVEYELEVRFEARGWPDWSRGVPIRVYPAGTEPPTRP